VPIYTVHSNFLTLRASDGEDGRDMSSDDGTDDEDELVTETYFHTSSSSLDVIAVPEKHQKDLTPREVNQVEELQTFFVPPKKEHLGVREIIQGAQRNNKQENKQGWCRSCCARIISWESN